MTPYYDADGITLYLGDCREQTAWLAADVLVTDPPYGRAWRQGDTGTGRGWASDRHDGIVNDSNTDARDAALGMWGERPALVFGDLLLPPPARTKHVLIYDKGVSAGFTGALAGYRRNAEGIYLLGPGWRSGLGGESCIVTTRASTGGNLARTTGHPHTKPLDLLQAVLGSCPAGAVAAIVVHEQSPPVGWSCSSGDSCSGSATCRRVCTRIADGGKRGGTS